MKQDATPGATLPSEPSIPSEGSRPRELLPPCKHAANHTAEVRIAVLQDTGRFMAEVRIRCAECGVAFQFLGLPLGLNLDGATMSVDGEEARLAVAPVGRVMRPLEGLSGLGVKAS